ncbi:MAG TPA: KH domain-containing protein [Candidatus Saccharimonadales bacterium]|nr:KH domain-containing protein [Candidatus Saccharimonadales bacterium]
MSSIDQQFVEFIVKSLVSKPDAVTIERRIDEKGVLLELTVDPEDLGRVIGKRGATAQSLRTLLRALGTKNDARYNLKIVDNGEPGAGGSSSGRTDLSDDDTDTNTASSRDDSSSSSMVSKTRKELEELDDLEV